MIKNINLKTYKPVDMIDITDLIKKEMSSINIKEGLCTIYCPHTTAGITINENSDPDVKKDILLALDSIVPGLDYKHLEGNSKAHILSSVIGSEKTIPIKENSLILGTWQGIFFCEFDGPRKRTISIAFHNSAQS